MTTTDRTTASPAEFTAALASWEAREPDPLGAVERAAIALYVAEEGDLGDCDATSWEHESSYLQADYRGMAQAVIHTLQGPVPDPLGWEHRVERAARAAAVALCQQRHPEIQATLVAVDDTGDSRDAVLACYSCQRAAIPVAAAALSADAPAEREAGEAAALTWSVGDPDPTPMDGDSCNEPNPQHYLCTWNRDASHPTWHVAGDGDKVCAVWPVESSR